MLRHYAPLKLMKQQIFTVKKIDDWKAVAQAVARELTPGTILGLSGPLGAGKTTFVQYLAEELGAEKRPKSPTFTLRRDYSIIGGRSMITKLIHVDAYRIERSEDLLPLNLDEDLLAPGTAVAIEWPENVKEWIAKRKATFRSLEIRLGKGEEREVFFT